MDPEKMTWDELNGKASSEKTDWNEVKKIPDTWNEETKTPKTFKKKIHYVMLVVFIVGVVAIIGVGIYIGVDLGIKSPVKHPESTTWRPTTPQTTTVNSTTTTTTTTTATTTVPTTTTTTPEPPTNIKVLYTAENRFPEVGEVFTESEEVLVPTGSNAFDIMHQATQSNSILIFNYTVFEGLGAAITAINGIESDHSQELSWTFMKRNSSDLCLHSVGVNTYIPVDGEELYFSMEKYSIFNNVTSCTTGTVEPHDDLTTSPTIV